MTKRIFNTRTGRTKEQTVKAYSLFLTIVRQNHDLGQDTSLKQLSMRLHIGSNITNKDLPSDLFTAPYEEVTSLDYAEKWLNDYLRPLRKQRKANTKAKESAKDEPLGGIFEHEMETPQMSVADIMAEIERTTQLFILDMTTAIEKLKALNNNQ